jgi:hypothetical protein
MQRRLRSWDRDDNLLLQPILRTLMKDLTKTGGLTYPYAAFLLLPLKTLTQTHGMRCVFFTSVSF